MNQISQAAESAAGKGQLPQQGWPWLQFGLFPFALVWTVLGLEQSLALVQIALPQIIKECSVLLAILAGPIFLFGLGRRAWLQRQGSTMRTYRFLRYLNGSLLGLGLLLMLLAMTVPAIHQARLAADRAGAQAQGPVPSLELMAEWKTVHSTDGRLELQVPASWNLFDNAGLPPTSLVIFHPTTDFHAVVFLENKQDLATKSLEAYVDATLMGFLGPHPEAKVLERTNCTIGDRPAIQVVVNNTMNQVNMVFLLTFCETADAFCMLRSGTVPSRFEAEVGEFRQIATSLRAH